MATAVADWVKSKQLANVCFIPVPLGKDRQQVRGHNQVVSVLQQSSQTYVGDVLSRTKETVPQASLDRQHRLYSIKNAFVCDVQKIKTLSYPIIILLDDVVTTGATLNEARATLVPHLHPDTTLICLALAH